MVNSSPPSPRFEAELVGWLLRGNKSGKSRVWVFAMVHGAEEAVGADELRLRSERSSGSREVDSTS
jgi:hypothetical protein